MTPKKAFYICLRKSKRILKFEPIVLKDSGFSCYYAIDIIKGRWPEAEYIIKQDDWYWKLYCEYFNIKKEKVNWKIGL